MTFFSFFLFSFSLQVFYYSTGLFISAGLKESHAKFATIGVGAVMVGMTLVSIMLMDRAGRRTLHLYGVGGMFIFSIFITISLLIKVTNFPFSSSLFYNIPSLIQRISSVFLLLKRNHVNSQYEDSKIFSFHGFLFIIYLLNLQSNGSRVLIQQIKE